MNEQQFGYRVRQTLNRGLSLEAGSLERLAAARERALARQRATAPASWLAWAGEVGGAFSSPKFLVSRLVLPGLVLALGLFIVNYWHQAQLAQENAEIDAQVLTGDLPIDAYLDKGFDAWLRRSSE